MQYCSAKSGASAYQATVREDKLSPESFQEHTPLDAHRVRHREDQSVALRGRQVGQSNARVAARRLDLQRNQR